MFGLKALSTGLFAAASVSGIQLWKTPGQIPTDVPARCRAALSTNITCDFLVTADSAANGEVVVGEAADVFCNSACRDSLRSFTSSVTSGCGHTQYKLWENSTMTASGQAMAEGLLWANSLLCIQDESGVCLPELYDGGKELCSDCGLKFAATMVSTDYGRGHVDEEGFQELLSSCSAPANSYTYSYTPPPPLATTTGGSSAPPSPTPTCRGTTITVQEGDTCESISRANSVATDRMIADNYMDYSCRELAVGMKLCIQDTCTIAQIQQGQTCEDITSGKGFTIVQLTSWNPTLKTKCDSNITPNLDALAGRSICVEAPGPFEFPTTAESTTKRSWTLSSPLFTSFETASVETTYEGGPLGTTTLFDPSYTPPAETHTALDSSKESIISDYTKYCWITEEDWAQGYDADAFPAACLNLMNTYCYYSEGMPSPTPLTRAPAVCTPDRSQYTLQPAPDPVVTPTPHQPNLTPGCSNFHKVASGQFCADVASEYGIDLDDFYKWNPDVGSDCRNLQLGVWVCVGYDERLVPTVTPVARVTGR